MPINKYLQRLIRIGLTPLILLAVALSVAHLVHTRWHRQSEALQTAKQLGAFLDSKLEMRLRALQVLAGSPLVNGEGVSAELYQAAQAFAQTFRTPVLLADELGQVLLHTSVAYGLPLRPMARPAGASAREVALSTGLPAVGDLINGPVLQKEMIALAVPVPQVSQRRLIFVTTMDKSIFQRRLEGLEMPAWALASILDSTGEVIAVRGNFDPAAPAAWYEHREVLRSTIAPWSLVVQVSGQALFVPMLLDAFLLVSVLLLALGAAQYAAKRASRRLQDGLSSLAQGEVGPPSSKDIAEIASTRQLLQTVDEQRKLTLDELRLSEQRVWQLLILMPEPVLVIKAGEIIFANEAAGVLLGRPSQDLVGRTAHELVHPDDRAEVLQVLPSLRETVGAEYTTEICVVRADRNVRDVSAKIARLDWNNGPVLLLLASDITEFKAARAQLEQSRVELRRLLNTMIDVQEDERRRIALEIHDDLQQRLIAISLYAADVRSSAGQAGRDLEKVAQAIEEGARQAIASTRRIINDLRPQVLDDLGLIPALESLVLRFADDTGLEATFSCTGVDLDEVALDLKVSSNLYRVAQEALNNVHKHAGARYVGVTLHWKDRTRLELHVQDDGRGIAPIRLANTSSLGLVGMRERMLSIGGTLDIRPADRGGTLLIVSLPHLP